VIYLTRSQKLTASLIYYTESNNKWNELPVGLDRSVADLNFKNSPKILKAKFRKSFQSFLRTGTGDILPLARMSNPYSSTYPTRGGGSSPRTKYSSRLLTDVLTQNHNSGNATQTEQT